MAGSISSIEPGRFGDKFARKSSLYDSKFSKQSSRRRKYHEQQEAGEKAMGAEHSKPKERPDGSERWEERRCSNDRMFGAAAGSQSASSGAII